MKADAETIETSLLNLVKSKIAAKLAEITTEKGDSITLDVPIDNQYFNSTDDEVDNRKLSVQYGLIDGAPLSIGSNTSEDYTYLFLFYIDEINLQTGVCRKMIFRYIRALKEIFEENFKKFPYLSTLKITTIAPTSASWSENENSPVYKVGGVYVQTSLVN